MSTSFVIVAIVAALLSLGAAGSGAGSPAALLLEVQARQSFVRAHRDGQLRVRFKPDLGPFGDPELTPYQWTTASVLRSRGDRGRPLVVASTSRLDGASLIELEVSPRRWLRAEAVPVAAGRTDSPLVRLLPERPEALSAARALTWAPGDAAVAGKRAWTLERPTSGLPRPDDRVDAVLVDTEILGEVEHPLERFRYVPLRAAEGQALLDAEGRILCVVFRRVPGADALSLCAPEESAFGEPDQGSEASP